MSADRPQFLPGQVSYAYTWAGQHRLLQCHLLAEPAATVDWFVRGIKLENNDTFQIISSDSNSSLEVSKLIRFSSFVRKALYELGLAKVKILLRHFFW